MNSDSDPNILRESAFFSRVRAMNELLARSRQGTKATNTPRIAAQAQGGCGSGRAQSVTPPQRKAPARAPSTPLHVPTGRLGASELRTATTVSALAVPRGAARVGAREHAMLASLGRPRSSKAAPARTRSARNTGAAPVATSAAQPAGSMGTARPAYGPAERESAQQFGVRCTSDADCLKLGNFARVGLPNFFCGPENLCAYPGGLSAVPQFGDGQDFDPPQSNPDLVGQSQSWEDYGAWAHDAEYRPHPWCDGCSWVESPQEEQERWLFGFLAIFSILMTLGESASMLWVEIPVDPPDGDPEPGEDELDSACAGMTMFTGQDSLEEACAEKCIDADSIYAELCSTCCPNIDAIISGEGG